MSTGQAEGNSITPPAHGGRLQGAQRRFPDAPAPWIDLSTGINPWPWPLPDLTPGDWSRLPEPENIAALEAAAAGIFGISDPACVIAVPGSDSAMRIIPHLLAVRSVAIIGPTYGGHGEAWAAWSPVEVAPNDLAQAAAQHDVVIVVSPNNPDGHVIAPADLEAARAVLVMRGGTLIVDQAFADIAPDAGASLYPGGAVPDGLLALRSFGKFFGLAGLRLGFVVAGEALAARLRPIFGAWPVSGPAVAIGGAAYRDRDWAVGMRGRLSDMAAQLDSRLADAGFGVIGGTSLFRLIAHPGAASIADHLARHGLLVRSFADRPHLIRLGLPADADSLDRLLSALTSWRSSHD